MDKNTIIGYLLILGLVLTMSVMNTPSKEELEEKARLRDSIQNVELQLDSRLEKALDTIVKVDTKIVDSVRTQQLRQQYGESANAFIGTEDTFMIENDVFKVRFTNKGGKIASVELKKYTQLVEDDELKTDHETLYLLRDKENRFEYQVNQNGESFNTSELFFESEVSSEEITFTANLGGGQQIVQEYSLKPGSYEIDYKGDFNGFKSGEKLDFYWETHLESLEKNVNYEKNFYSTMYYQILDEKVKFLNRRKSKEKSLEGTKVKWVSHAQQFFNTTLIASDHFEASSFQSVNIPDEEEGLKILKSKMQIPISNDAGSDVAMTIYTGPNEFNTLKEMGNHLQEIVPFGYGFFGSINRWVIRPLFNFLLGFFSSKGLVIIMLTLLVKLALYPLTYKMLHSQAKMAVLKP